MTAAAATALAGGALSMAAAGAQASTPRPSAGASQPVAQTGTAQAGTAQAGTAQHPAWPGVNQPRFRYAVNAFGHKVPVGPLNFAPTPVHPEKITHPDADYMGAVNAKYASWAKAAKAPLVIPKATVPQIPGIDVSSHQGNINWASVAPSIDFVYAKATEGTYYTSPNFTNQYLGPFQQGLIRGAYHFAIPNNSSGAAQADYFIAHGGGWSGDGQTLPGALDIEYNPYSGGECYGLSQSSMVSWISAFTHEYASREGVFPTIYSTTDWWTTCTGNSSAFSGNDPLWIANYSASGGGPLPAGWGFYTFWQYADHGSLPGDQDVFNGALSRLQVLAKNG